MSCQPGCSVSNASMKSVARTRADGDAESQAYNVDQILDMQFDKHGARIFQVSWEGYPEITWEPESNLDGCLEKLGSFFSDPKHQAPRCRHGHRKGKLWRLAV